MLFVDVHYVANQPLALRDLVLQSTRYAIVEIKMAPAVAFGKPDNFSGFFRQRAYIRNAERTRMKVKITRRRGLSAVTGTAGGQTTPSGYR